jgi:hypothetical protein
MAESDKKKTRRGNPDKLKKFGEDKAAPTHEEAVERGRKGGINSGISRRRKADMRESLEQMLSMRASGSTRELLEKLGYAEEDQTNANAIAATLLSLGLEGDHKALDTLLNYVLAVKEDDRKTRESEARIMAMQGGVPSAVTSSDDEDGDVVIYLPKIEEEEDSVADLENTEE